MYVQVSYQARSLEIAIASTTNSNGHWNHDTVLRSVLSNRFTIATSKTAHTYRMRRFGDSIHAVLRVEGLDCDPADAAETLACEDFPADNIHKAQAEIFEIESPASILGEVSGLIS
jgi:hypothetical protein